MVYGDENDNNEDDTISRSLSYNLGLVKKLLQITQFFCNKYVLFIL